MSRSDVYIKEDMPQLLIELIEGGYVHADGTFIGFGDIQPFDPSKEAIFYCPHCHFLNDLKYSRTMNPFLLVCRVCHQHIVDYKP